MSNPSQCDQCGEYMGIERTPDIVGEVPKSNNVIVECDACGAENTMTKDEAHEAGFT